MLTKDNFTCPEVRKVLINGVECWRYFGNDLSECVEFAKFVQSRGEKFYDPLIDEIRSAHRAILDKPMVLLLVAMDHYHRYQEYVTMAYPNDFPVISPKAARGFSTNYNYLVHFGLLSKENRGDVHYWVTNLGRKFIAGESIRCELFNIGPQVVGYNDTSWGTIGSYFTEAEFEGMKKPLWFLPERLRLEILTPEELAIACS